MSARERAGASGGLPKQAHDDFGGIHARRILPIRSQEFSLSICFRRSVRLSRTGPALRELSPRSGSRVLLPTAIPCCKAIPARWRSIAISIPTSALNQTRRWCRRRCSTPRRTHSPFLRGHHTRRFRIILPPPRQNPVRSPMAPAAGGRKATSRAKCWEKRQGPPCAIFPIRDSRRPCRISWAGNTDSVFAAHPSLVPFLRDNKIKISRDRCSSAIDLCAGCSYHLRSDRDQIP